MLLVASALKGYTIEATDGRIGTVNDVLFDDSTWKMRWLVVDTGEWLSGRKVLVHPSAMGRPDYERETVPVALTKAQVQASPDIERDAPVSRQLEANLYGYYGWDPLWGGDNLGGGGIASSLIAPGYAGETGLRETSRMVPEPEDGDPHLRSVAAVTGYHIRATDGAIGHVENFLINDDGWGIRYLIVDTKNWWPGQHVLISPYAVKEIDWAGHEIRLDVDRGQVKASPAWDPLDLIDRDFEKRLHGHYGWPGYGW